jgi:hypothetical protein
MVPPATFLSCIVASPQPTRNKKGARELGAWQRGRPDIKRLGNPNGARALKGKQVGNAAAVSKIKADASQRVADLRAIAEDIRHSGITGVRGIADAARGIRAPRCDIWHPTAVSRLLSRLQRA